jgi:hypothetical protein
MPIKPNLHSFNVVLLIVFAAVTIPLTQVVGVDRNTRVIVFAMNLQLLQGETSSAVTVHLVDSNNQPYDIAAEDVRPVPNFPFTQVVFRLPDHTSVGTCIITLKAGKCSWFLKSLVVTHCNIKSSTLAWTK